jgi:hypothetical protein
MPYETFGTFRMVMFLIAGALNKTAGLFNRKNRSGIARVNAILSIDYIGQIRQTSFHEASDFASA